MKKSIIKACLAASLLLISTLFFLSGCTEYRPPATDATVKEEPQESPPEVVESPEAPFSPPDIAEDNPQEPAEEPAEEPIQEPTEPTGPTEEASGEATEANTTQTETTDPAVTEDVSVTDSALPRDLYGLPMPMTALEEGDSALCLAETSALDDSYFTDSVFFGDSVTLGLKNYATKQRKQNSDFMSNASFIAIGSYGVYEALRTPADDTMHSLYNGVQTQPQDILAGEGAKTVFISLGLNDVGLYSLEEHMKHYATLILRIQTACPGIKIVIMPTTPLTVEGEKRHLYNYKIDTYNSALIKLAQQYSCYYADIASVLKNSEGYLDDDLSSDNYCHLQPEAYDLILNYLKTHATPDAVPESSSEVRETVIEAPAEAEGYEGEMGEN